MISRQRAFLSLPGKSKPDWQIVCDVAMRMGFHGFNFENAAEIFREHAALSTFENNGTRALDIGACANLSDQAYQVLPPFQWPRPKNKQANPRMFADGIFYGMKAKSLPRLFGRRGVRLAAFPLGEHGRIRDHGIP